MKKIDWKKLILLEAIPLAVGGLSYLLTSDAMKSFELIKKPPFSPPGWLFPVAWTALYILMGAASYLVCVSDASLPRKRRALTAYALQLIANFVWPLIFFGLEAYLAALLCLLLLWVLIAVTLALFHAIDERSGELLIPYLIWVSFAGYLNYGVYLLN